MGKSILATFCLGFFLFSAHAQHLDTLRVLVLSPGRVTSCAACQQAVKTRNEQLLSLRAAAVASKKQERNAHAAAYAQQPSYTRRMFDNDLAYLDSLNLVNYVAYASREFIAYRLYRPYKIKPRLVLVSTAKQKESNLTSYQVQAASAQADFIINFPVIQIEREGKGFRIRTTTELYSRQQHAVVLSQEGTATLEDQPMDYPMCVPGQLECTLVASVYESLMRCLPIIAASRR